jgi:hypothetical protein
LAQLVLGQVGDGEFQRGEVLDEVAQHGIGQQSSEILKRSRGK